MTEVMTRPLLNVHCSIISITCNQSGHPTLTAVNQFTCLESHLAVRYGEDIGVIASGFLEAIHCSKLVILCRLARLRLGSSTRC